MPQLDTLTYLTQYVYLLITFVAVYFFVLSFIIPKTLCSLKVRQKLNSLNAEVNLSVSSDNKKLGPIDSIEKSALNSESTVIFLQYNDLLNNHFCAETAKTSSAESLLKLNRWLISVRALQLVQVMRIKKLLCEHTVQKIKGFF